MDEVAPRRGPGRPPADPPRRQRNIRIEDAIWTEVEETAERKGLSVTDEVRFRLAQLAANDRT